MTRVDQNGSVGGTGYACLVLALVLFASGASAGVVIEPNIVYANLSDAPDEAVDLALKGSINAVHPECWVKGGGLIYMKKRPPGVDDKLIRRAVLQGRLSAKRSLSNALLSSRDDEVNGLDGVVVYVDRPSPRLASMTAKTLTVDSQNIADVRNAKDVELAFCAVKPDVVPSP